MAVPNMSCIPACEQPVHVPKEVIPKQEAIPLFVHELIDKKVWKNDPNATREAKEEAQGLIDAGTWTYDKVIPRHVLEKQARDSGEKIAIGRRKFGS